MATRPNTQGFILSITMVSAGQRYMTVFPMASAAALVFDDAKKIIDAFLLPGVVGLLQDCLAVDTYVSGVSVDGLMKDILIPQYRVFAPTEYVGTIAGQSCPPQSSVLLAYYAYAQLDDGSNRVKSARNFLCPPPESKSNGYRLDPTYAETTCGLFAAKMIGDNFSYGGGTAATRVLAIDKTPGHSLVLCDAQEIRTSSFTQRRREAPVL